MQQIPTEDRCLVLLSPQERRVLRLVARGSSNKAIAAHLGMALSTVKWHVWTLMDGLGLDNRVDLAVWAVAHPESLSGKAVDPTHVLPFDRAA